MSEEEKREEHKQEEQQPTAEQSDEPSAEGTESGEGKSDLEREEEEAKEEMKKLEEDPPENLEDWPRGKAMYETFGGPEGQDHAYHEGPETKLGPDSVRHHEGGDVEIAGEMVDNPEEYKGDPIPGGPTDPESAGMPGDKTMEEDEDAAGGSDEGDSSAADDENDAETSSEGEDRERS